MDSAHPLLHRTCTPVEVTTFDPDEGPKLGEAVVEAIAAAAEVGPTELPPLYHAVDLDALSHLFSAHRSEVEGLYTFAYEDWQVFVAHDGTVLVCDRREPTEPEPVFEHAAD